MLSLTGLVSGDPISGSSQGRDLLWLMAVVVGMSVVRRLWQRWISDGVPYMNRVVRVGVIVVLALAVGVILMLKQSDVSARGDGATGAPVASGLPRVLDLGATQCIPCKMMAPILEELKKEYAGKIQIDFIDVWENEAAGHQYRIDGIPTQIFFDASGKELYRHEGFMPKEDILAKCKELGFGVP